MNRATCRARSGARFLWIGLSLGLAASSPAGFAGCAKGLPALPSDGKAEPEAGVGTDGGGMDAKAPAPMDAAKAPVGKDSGDSMADAAMDAGGGTGIDAACGTNCCNGLADKTAPTFESDVDCGGPVCRKCNGGEICIANTDCASLVCNATKTCDAPSGMTTVGPCVGKAMGTACTDTACPTNTMCDALGNCGIVGDCAMMPDTNCTKSTNAGHAYWACDQQENWSDARAKCMAVGLDLVHVGDMAENTFVASEIKTHAGNDAWLGVSVVGGGWVWIDDNKPITYAGWGVGLPPTPIANQCGFSDDNGVWTAQVCTINHGYVCEGVVK